MRSVRLGPTADHAADLVNGAGGVLVAADVEMLLLEGEAHEKAQLFQAEVGAGEVVTPVARVGGLDQRVENVERS